MTPPPIQDLEAQGPVVIDISNGNRAAFTTGRDPSSCWRVRVVKDGPGYRVLYLEE